MFGTVLQSPRAGFENFTLSKNNWDLKIGKAKLKHCEIAKRCPEYISSVVKVSSCSYQKTVSSFFRTWVLRIRVLSQFEFLSVSQFEFCCYLSFSQFEFCHNLSFVAIWVLSQLEFYNNLEFCHSLSFATIWAVIWILFHLN